ncbi:histidine kinase [Paenactinomyces guangxiensis]|uniref:Sensor histidine kinase n=1 Tax=Paenactinomyces guangxiensis TaxID=1490290 RepID=A0A7W1WQH8_9BACL|nr:sensor histidine kinase [Paenactinomyces guangxiensis]MBA4494152.1 sensor histidine kinase [Paenactinomyces guangxiensis]MBH8591103.1 sensor histidine kinase [Paenactinomyces guangxiensis]
MSRKKIAGIHWRLIRFTVWICTGLSLLVLVLTLLSYGLGLQTLLTAQIYDIPLLILIPSLVVLTGAVSGFIFGYGIKRRMEMLAESIMRFERGNFAHRVPASGEDEIGMVADHLNRMAERIEKQVASLQKLSTEKAQWQERMKQAVISEERQRLARELHDAVSQQLFAISMMSSAVKETLPEADIQINKQITMIEKMAGNAQNEMRALLLHLRPVTLEGKGLKEGLEELLEEFKAKHSVEIDWEVSDLPNLAKGIEDHLFRIVQEGLSNVFRHSQATAVTVRLAARNRQVYLKIIDNGVGFDMNKPKASSYGLQSIQERASAIGGIAEVVSFPGKGTQVEVKVPIVDEK